MSGRVSGRTRAPCHRGTRGAKVGANRRDSTSSFWPRHSSDYTGNRLIRRHVGLSYSRRTETVEREVQRLKLIMSREGIPAAVEWATRTLKTYREALRRPKFGARSHFARLPGYREEFVVSCLVLRSFLRQAATVRGVDALAVATLFRSI